MSYIIEFKFDNKAKEYLVLEIPRDIFDEMIELNQNLDTNIPAGTLSFSTDLMYIIVNKEEFKENKFFNFIVDIQNGDVKGIIQEPDYKEGGEMNVLQLY
jgi:hypothetical protein